MNLADAITQAHEVNENALAAKVPQPRTRLSEEQAKLFHRFAEWCKQYGVRSLPARPTTIAAFLASLVADDPFAAAEAIRVAHQVQQLPCRLARTWFAPS